MELSNEEDEEKKGRKNTNNNMNDDSKVDKIKKKYKILLDSLQDLETAEANFCHCSVGKKN